MIPALPPIGMGTAAIGNLYRPISDADAEATVAAALQHGFGYFDTAPHYGFGLAERRLGDALAVHDPAHAAIISTKVGRTLKPTDASGERHGFVDADPYEPEFDYGHDAVLQSFEASRTRLRRDRIDILLAHDLGSLTHGHAHDGHLRTFLEGGYRAMRRLRDEGSVSAIGIGVNEIAICEQLVGTIDIDVILLAGRYTLLEQRALERLLPQCADHDVRLIIGAPYNSGILAEGPDAAAHYDYARAPADVLARVRRIAAICDDFGVALPAAALAFPMAHSQVDCVIPGLAGRDQVDATARFAAANIPGAFWSRLSEENLIDHDAPLPGEVDIAATRGPKLILIHPDDNVLIAIAPVAAGQVIRIDGRDVHATHSIEVGHKVARQALSPGDKIIRYGAPVGSMTAPALVGDHVHIHNMRSDYIAPHDRHMAHEGVE